MFNLFALLDKAVLKGAKCLVVTDRDYRLLLQELERREDAFGVRRDGAIRYMLYRGVHVFPDAQTVMIGSSEPVE